MIWRSAREIWQRRSLKQKIAIGFGWVLGLFIVTGVLIHFGVGGIVGNAKVVIRGNQLDATLAQREVDHLNWANQLNALLTDEAVVTLDIETDDHQCGFGSWLYSDQRRHAEEEVPELARLLKAIEIPHQKLHLSAIAIKKRFRPADPALGAFLQEKKIDHLSWMNRILLTLHDRDQSNLGVETDPRQCSLGLWLHGPELAARIGRQPELAAFVKTLSEPHQRLHQAAAMINGLLADNRRMEALYVYKQKIVPAAEETLGALDKVISWQQGEMEGLKAAQEIYARQTLPALAEVQELLQEIRRTARGAIMTDEVMLEAAAATEKQVAILLLVTVAIGVFMAWLTATDLSKLLTRLSDTLRNNGVQVAAAASEIASASTSLSDDASQQAAVVEETAASLASMSEGSRETAALTAGSEQLMRENIEKSAQSLKALVDLTGSMAEIERDSDKIRQIITTIESIAFQTNLLALNAAVEAARAGEAGAGFAVVADEVRNLAHRAGAAAKDIAELLEATVKRVSQSAHSLKNVNHDFEGIIESATAIGDKNSAITQATEGFVHQINQVNEATALAGDSAQRIASCSEETAAASEELTAQAEELRGMVIELVRAVKGERGVVWGPRHYL